MGDERREVTRARECVDSGACGGVNGGVEHSERCAWRAWPTARDEDILTFGGDERELSVAYASGRWDEETPGVGKFVVHPTWTPERLRGRGLGQKAVRGAVEFGATQCPSHIAPRLRVGAYDRRHKLGLAEYVDATCPFAKRALEELRREANL